MSAILEVRDLRKSFDQAGTRIEVLRGAELALERGATLAIVGRSGSGKSTLLSLLAGLDAPTAGEVRVDGQPIGAMDEPTLARFRALRLGIVFQQFHLMSHLTALENIGLPLEIAGDPEAQARAREALEQVGLGHRAGHFPHQLSGGEKQRVAIARAFVTRPAVLLADEPSGNLDAETGAQVMELLFGLVRSRGMTMVLVTHNDELAARCDRLLRLEGGLLCGTA